MLRHVMPAAMVAAGLLLAPAPALAHAEGGDMECCQEEAKTDAKAEAKAKGAADCCEAEGDAKNACCEAEGGAKNACCEAEGAHAMKDGHHGMKDRRGMKDHHGMKGHHGMMMGGKQYAAEIRYLPVFYNSTNQWLILTGGKRGSKNDVFSLGMERNFAIQTFNNGPAGFWLAPYSGIVPRVGYSVGDARVDVGLLVGLGGMARTANVGGTSDVLQARLMWVVEPKAELMWQGDGHGMGLTASYLMTQHQADLGGFIFGLKGTFGGFGGGKGMGHHGDMDHKGHGDKDRKGGDGHKGHKD
jgi:hypothetical protein